MPQTEKQRQASFQAAGLSEEQIRNVDLGLPSPDQPIRSDDVSGAPSIDFQETGPEIIPTVPPVKLTPEEQKTRDLFDDLRELNEETLGEEEFRRKQEEERDVASLRKIQRDLETQLEQIQFEGAAIPSQLQEEAEGRGITKGGLRPIQAGEVRKNALRQLSVSAALASSRGNLGLALEQVDRAVEARFGPIREEIRVKKANAQLIIDSPLFKLEDKNRAQRQIDAQNKLEKKVAKEEANYQSIQEKAVEAASIKGVDPRKIREIQKLLDDPTDANVVEAERILAEVRPQQDISGLVRAVQSGQLNLSNVLSEFREQVASQVNFDTIPDEDEIFEVPTFEQFVDEFLQTKEGQQIIAIEENKRGQSLSIEERRKVVGEVAKESFDQAVAALPEPDISALAKKLGFSTTAVNRGIQNSGLTLSEFARLSSDEQRNFINADSGGNEETSNDGFMRAICKGDTDTPACEGFR